MGTDTPDDFILGVITSRGTNFNFKYLLEFGTKFKNILWYESGAHVGLIHEKTEDKNLCYCTFKVRNCGPEEDFRWTKLGLKNLVLLSL